MLTNTAVKAAKPKDKVYRLTDGMSMYLLVKSTGKKYWRMDYTLKGRRKTYAIGVYPHVSLKQARVERDKVKALLSQKIDPVEHRRQEKEAQNQAVKNTFGMVAVKWLDRKKKAWAHSHARSIEQRLNKNIIPWLGHRPIADITAKDVLKVLQRIEARGAIETARRCRSICSQVFLDGIAAELCENDPASGLQRLLQPWQPNRMAAITDPAEAGALMRSISEYKGEFTTRCALKFSAYTFARPGEVRHAEWSEFSWRDTDWIKTWTIPADKMKMRRPHVVPLAPQVIDILEELFPVTGHSKYVFPSLVSAAKPMSENTVNCAIRRMGIGRAEMTAHGFRAMASSILHEAGFDHDDIERQLAHARKNKVAAIYDRSERLPERYRMMVWYADLLVRLESGETIDIRGLRSLERGENA